MRITFLLCCIFLAGCASSERMARLSGGVVQEYSAPQKHRIRSEKFQKKTAVFSGEKKPGRSGFAEKSLINIWPFFFRSDDYYSALWPMFDMDPYGFAVRPFFNKEGDDYSVLFPLSSWNPADKDGWVTLAYWNKKGFGFVPLFHQSLTKDRGMCFYAPLCIRSWHCNALPTWRDPLKKWEFLLLFPGYYQKQSKVDTGEFQHLYPAWGKVKYPQYLRELLAYRLAGTGTPVPRNVKELDAYRKKIFAACPELIETHYGLLPLYFSWNRKYSSGFNLAGLLLHYDKETNRSKLWSLCHLLCSYTHYRSDALLSHDTEEKWVIPPLLTYAGYTDYKVDTPKRKEVLSFQTLAGRTHEPFAKNLPEMKKLYKKITGKEMPQVICSYALASLWLKEYAAKQNWQTVRESYGGFLPLYCFFAGRKKFFWTSPLLLTFSETRDKGSCIFDSYFLSLPLFTLWKNNAGETLRTTAGPVGYYHKIRIKNPIECPVFDRNTWWVKEYQQNRFEDTYALCGLYYHGRDGFAIAKKGMDAKMVESIRKRSFELKRLHEQYQREAKAVDKRLERNKNWKVQKRLDELKKMVDAEEIRLEQERLNAKLQKFEKDLKAWCADAARFGVRFDRSALEKKNFEPALKAFLDKTTDQRYSEDYGSGLFFRKELAENGDFNWHIFAYLASGSKKGDREKAQVLHFFYRRNREGEREEKIIFPFITIRKNKNSSSASFLWRLWEKHETPAGKGGYVFFVPWGK